MHMCKTKMAVDASDPNPTRSSRTTRSTTQSSLPQASPRTPSTPRKHHPTFGTAATSSSEPSTSYGAATTTSASSTSFSSRTSLSSLRESISQNPHIYDISEIRSATNNFLAKRFSPSSSTASWRCTLRNTDTVVFQRKFRRKLDTTQLKQLLSVLCRSHHLSVIKLLGVSISGDYIYLVYEFVSGANLADLLRNKRNPEFTVLSTWNSRMQIAADLAHGLDYIHNKTGLNMILVHNHIKSSSVVVTEPLFHANICHFGAVQLCGESDENEMRKSASSSKGKGEITAEGDDDDEDKGRGGGEMQFEGVRGYMSPEFLTTGIATQKSDVYAFGVVVLELLSGKEPFKFRYDKSTGDYVRTSIIETARAAVDGGHGVDGRVREWVDRRLKDSFPVGVAEKLIRLALDCVHVEPDKRPDMGRVAGKISRLYLESRNWSDSVKMPDDQISVSLAPR